MYHAKWKQLAKSHDHADWEQSRGGGLLGLATTFDYLQTEAVRQTVEISELAFMSSKRKSGSKEGECRVPDLGRHEVQCKICGHQLRGEIDRDFVNWASSNRIAKAYKLARTSLYRHAHATGLFSKRQKNIRTALEKIIEHAGDVEVNAAAVVSAVQAYAKINAQGQWVERSETVSLNDLFDRMTREELEAYATQGTLPGWFPAKAEQEFN